MADYTGGTKTMTAALVAAALDTPGVELRLVAGTRANLVQVDEGTQYSVLASVTQTRAVRQMEMHLAYWSRRDYASAAHGLRSMMAPADVKLRARWQRALHLSEALTSWDLFDHRGAYDRLKPYQTMVARTLLRHWEALRELSVESSAHGDALRLWDLMLNAERRADNQRYDDATARVYRLLEWTAQWTLKRTKGWSTADLPRDVAEAHGIPAGPKGRYQVGLRGAWELLASRCPGPAADFFHSEGERMLDHINKRNQSILAHGSQPLSQLEWRALWSWTTDRFRPLLEQLLADVVCDSRLRSCRTGFRWILLEPMPDRAHQVRYDIHIPRLNAELGSHASLDLSPCAFWISTISRRCTIRWTASSAAWTASARSIRRRLGRCERRSIWMRLRVQSH